LIVKYLHGYFLLIWYCLGDRLLQAEQSRATANSIGYGY